MYPERLLPKTDSVILDENHLPHDDSKIFRWHNPLDEDRGSIFDENDNLRADQIDYERFPGMSCNYAPPAIEDDLKINILKKELLTQWKVGDSIPEISDSDFEVKEEREVFGLHPKDLIKEEMPFTKTLNNSIVNYNLHINILHKPIRANFYHCELELWYPDGHEKKTINNFRDDKGWRRSVIINLRRLFEIHSFKV